MPNTDQYKLETTWSTRLTDDIILESIQGKIPPEMESNILGAINILNSNQYIDNKEIFIKLYS